MRRFRDLTTKEKKEYLAILFLLPFAYIWHLFRKANFRTLPKRAVAVCLALVMIAVMFPTTAFAANTHTHCICGATHKAVGDHDAEVSTTFTAVTDQNGLQDAATNGGSVYLANDITINAAITVTGDLTLCLNGKTLKNTASNTRVIHIDGGTLNLTDCGGTGTITGGSIINNTANDSPSGGIHLSQYLTFSGKPVISGNKYGSKDGSFDIYKNYTAIMVTKDFAPTGSPITVSVDPYCNDSEFLEAADSGVDIEKYIGYFDYVSEFPLYKKDGKYYAGFAIVEEPNGENNYTVKVSSDQDLSCQWYKEGLASKVLTDRDLFLMDGDYDPISQSFTMPYGGLEGYILLNAGDQLIVSSQSEIDAKLMGADRKRDGNTYTFTVTSTYYYQLWVAGDSDTSVKLAKNGSDFVEVEDQTELTLDTSNLEAGEYQCKLVWDLGTDDPYDDIEAWSEIVSYTIPTYTVTWKNHDGSVLETDTGVAYDTTPTYNGATPTKPDDENFTYTFSVWSPAVEAITGDTEYIAQFTAVSKRVDPTYTVTIPATVNEGESFAVSASGVVLNTNEKLTVTLQSDFTLTNEQGAELEFTINDGAILNNAQLISVTGNGDKNNPLSLTTDNLVVEIAEEAKYSGTYQGTITFTIAVDTAENN